LGTKIFSNIFRQCEPSLRRAHQWRRRLPPSSRRRRGGARVPFGLGSQRKIRGLRFAGGGGVAHQKIGDERAVKPAFSFSAKNRKRSRCVGVRRAGRAGRSVDLGRCANHARGTGRHARLGAPKVMIGWGAKTPRWCNSAKLLVWPPRPRVGKKQQVWLKRA